MKFISAFIVTSILTIGCLASFCNVVAQEKPKTLSELSILKAENFKLRTQLTQCRVDLLDRESRLMSQSLTSEQSQLKSDLSKELGCSIDLNTLTCEKTSTSK